MAVVAAPEEHPEWMLGAQVTDDGRYLLISVGEGCLPVNRCCPPWDACECRASMRQIARMLRSPSIDGSAAAAIELTRVDCN